MAPLPGERILIADADPGLRQQVSDRLLASGVAVDCVGDGRSAIDTLRSQQYAVVLLDVSLPIVAAERVLEFIRDAANGSRPIVFVLGEPSAARSLDVELVQIVIRKPCDLNHIADLVQSCVRNAGAKNPGRLRQDLPDRLDQLAVVERLPHDAKHLA